MTRDGIQVTGADMSRCLTPGFSGCTRSRYSGINIFAVGGSDLCQWFTRRGIDGIEVLAARWLHPLAIDEESKGWRSLSQSNTRVGDSGAGPYSIVSKISVTFMLSLPLDHRVVVCRRVVTGSEVRKLPFDVGKQAAGANAEERIVQPLVAQLLFHQDQPIERLFGIANAASRLKAYLVASSLEVIADGPHHYQADRERSVDRLFAGGGFDEISAGHHADETRHTGVAQGGKLVSGKDGLHVRLATGVTESPHFIV